jgi:hypothetical protein
MFQKIGIFLACFIFFVKTNAQTKATKSTVINDFAVSLHEESINKIITAIGDISGTNDYEVMFIKGKYHWTIQHPRISIKPDSSDFLCDAIVKCGLFGYKTQVLGDVKVTYDNLKNLIYIKITRAIFELYTEVFGKKVHIKDIQLEEYFKEPFAFEGPKTLATDMEFVMPDSTKKKIYLQPTDCKMELKHKEICTACEIAVADKPFKTQIKLTPPIQASKPVETGTVQAQKK